MKKLKEYILLYIFLLQVVFIEIIIIGNIFSETKKTGFQDVYEEETNKDDIEMKNDNQKILKIVKDIFDAYNRADNAGITSTLHKYINPGRSRLVLKRLPAGANSIVVNETVIYNGNIDLRNNRFDLDESEIYISPPDPFQTGFINGYANGSIVTPDGKTEKGPWKISCSLYKSGSDWLIDYIKFSGIVRLEYYTQLPAGYGKDPDRKWPLIIFLHGIGEVGGTLENIKHMNHSIPMVASAAVDFPFIAVSPLCPSLNSWENLPYSISNMTEEVAAKYSVDKDKIYLTGLSLGGIGTWNIALKFPDLFAAIAPVCGSVDPGKVERLKNLPVWAFHGADDRIVAMDEEQKAVDLLKACGGDIRYTVYPGVGHDAWNHAYTDKELYTWFLQHSRINNRTRNQ